MTYAGSRRIIDVDSHVIELDDFLWNAATPSERDRLPKMADQKVLPVAQQGLDRAKELFARRQTDPETRAKFEASLVQVHRNGWSRLGAFDPAERSHALDLFGFELQWVLPTFAFHQVAHTKDPSLLALGARVLNRAMGGVLRRRRPALCHRLPAAERRARRSGVDHGRRPGRGLL
jgi:hypothetical protein